MFNKSVNFVTLFFEEGFSRVEMAGFRDSIMKHHRQWNSLHRSISPLFVYLLTVSFVLYFSERNQFWLQIRFNTINFLVTVASRGTKIWPRTCFTLFDLFNENHFVLHFPSAWIVCYNFRKDKRIQMRLYEEQNSISLSFLASFIQLTQRIPRHRFNCL